MSRLQLTHSCSSQQNSTWSKIHNFCSWCPFSSRTHPLHLLDPLNRAANPSTSYQWCYCYWQYHSSYTTNTTTYTFSSTPRKINHYLDVSLRASVQCTTLPQLPLSYPDNTLSTHFFCLIYPAILSTPSPTSGPKLKSPVPAPELPISPSPSAFTVLHLRSPSEHQTVHCGDGCVHLTTG